MIKVKDILSRLRKTYSVTSKAKLLLKVNGTAKKYQLNGLYYGTLENGITFVAVHNLSEEKNLLVTDFIKQLMVDTSMWNENSVLIYDNSVECNPILDVKMTTSSVTLIVDDICKDIVRARYQGGNRYDNSIY